MNNRTEQFLKDPILPLLMRMSSPNVVAFLIQAIVLLTEVWFISQLGTTSLAAIALAFPLLMITLTMSGGALGGAVTSSVARSLGGRNTERAEKLLWHAILVSICGAMVFLAAFLMGGESLLRALGGSGQLLKESLSYGTVFLSGGIFVWLTGSLGGALRGMGNMRFPAALLIISSGIQVIFSGGFILGWFGLPALGITGAAVSTLISQAFMSVTMLFNLSLSSTSVKLRLSRLGFEKELFKDIFAVALPAALSPLSTVATILVLTGLVGQFGIAALAGYGIGSRIEFLITPLIFGIGTAMTTMVGANVGAKSIKRAEKIGWYGGISAGCLAGFIGITLAISPDLWIPLFTTDQETFSATKQYIQIVGPCYAFQGLGLSLYFASQGAKVMKWSMMANVMRFLVAAVGGGLAVYWLSGDLKVVYYASASAMVCLALVIAVPLKMGAWQKSQ